MKKALLAGLLLVGLLTTSCALKTTTPGQPGIPQTALHWTIVMNAALAKTNRAVQQSVATVQATGAITTGQARPIIIGCGRVAQASESIRGITSAGTEATWAIDGPKVRAVLAAANLNLPPSQNPTVDLATSAVNAALTLLAAEVRQ